ncbi:MAG TPA: trigger factor [Thermoanaerobaculia bacterium]|nr:trigger factor [Thermoanaerobaculia bacterium]
MTVLNYEDVSPIQKLVEVEIPADLISREANRVTSEFGKQAKVPGFRPGKIPVSVVRNRFAKEIEEEVVSRVLGQSFRDVVHEKGLEPVGEPKLEHIDAFIDGAPMKYKARFEVKPRIELGEYRGLEIEDPKIEVSETDVEAMVERLRLSVSHLRPVVDRGAEDGDVAMIEITSTPEDGEPFMQQGEMTVGEEGPLPQLNEALQGMTPEDAPRSFDRTFGDEAVRDEWKNKTVHFEVAMKALAIREKPDVTDELAKSVGGWESVDEMRQAITADIRKHREVEALRFKRTQVGEKLLAAHRFDVPEALIEEEIGKSLNNYARYLASQGVNIEEAEIDWRKIADEFRPEAVKRVQRGLLLEAIAKQENLTVSDVEVDAEIRRAAREQNREFADVKHHLKHDGGYEALRASMAQDRALELVLNAASTRA